jgi:hypothetical protein
VKEAKKDVETQTDTQEPSTNGIEAKKTLAPGPRELIKHLEDALKSTQRIFSVEEDQEHNQTQTDDPKPFTSGVEVKDQPVTGNLILLSRMRLSEARIL